MCVCVCEPQWRQAHPADGGDKGDGGHKCGYILRLPWWGRERGRKEASERRVNYHSAGCTDTVSPSPANQCDRPSCTHKEGNDTPVSRLPASGRWETPVTSAPTSEGSATDCGALVLRNRLKSSRSGPHLLLSFFIKIIKLSAELSFNVILNFKLLANCWKTTMNVSFSFRTSIWWKALILTWDTRWLFALIARRLPCWKQASAHFHTSYIWEVQQHLELEWVRFSEKKKRKNIFSKGLVKDVTSRSKDPGTL